MRDVAPAMRLSREESREQTRQRLIESAQDCVLRRGFDGASVGEIAEGAGFTKGAFFAHFETKEAILLEIARRHKLMSIERLSRIEAPEMDAAAAMCGLASYLDSIDADCRAELLDIELELQASRNPVFAEQYKVVEQEYRRALSVLVETLFRTAGRVMPASAEDLAATLCATTRGLVLQHAADPARPGIGARVRLVLQSLLATAAPSGGAAPPA